MGVFDRVEKKLEGAVSGVFARAFKGDVQPVEITARLQRELDTEAKLLSRERKLVPNEFTIGLSQHDYDRLTPYSKTLNSEIAKGYIFNGPVVIHYDLDASLPVGRFTVTSQAVAGVDGAEPPTPTMIRRVTPMLEVNGIRHPLTTPGVTIGRGTDASDAVAQVDGPGATTTAVRKAALVLEVNGVRHPLHPPGLVIGRGSDADLRINDPGISRRHAMLNVAEDGTLSISDLGSTNGIVVNGQRVREAALAIGSRIEIGSTRMSITSTAADV